MIANNESVYLVRYIITDQQNDHVIGIFTDINNAVKAAKQFDYHKSNWCHVQVEEIRLNQHMGEDFEDDLYWEAF